MSYSCSSASLSLPFSHSSFFLLFFLWFTDIHHPSAIPWLLQAIPCLCLSGKLWLPCHSSNRVALCGFWADSGWAFSKGLELDLQSLPIILSSFKQPTDNRPPQPPFSQPPIRPTIGILWCVSMESAVCRCSLGSLWQRESPAAFLPKKKREPLLLPLFDFSNLPPLSF